MFAENALMSKSFRITPA